MRKLFTTLSVLLMAAATMAQIPSYVPTNGLVGYWPFNGNANDESGNGNNGTVNGATLTTDRFGNPNAAYDFDGVNDYIQVANSPELTPNSDLSINFWVNKSSFQPVVDPDPAGAEALISLWGANPSSFSSDRAYVIYHNYSTSTFKTSIYLNDNSTVSTQFDLTEIELGQWQMITCTYLGNGFLSMYVNGTLISQTVVQSSATLNQGGYPLSFMLEPTEFGDDYNDGKLDDIGIWNRALTEQEITDMYQGLQPVCLPNYVPTNGLVGYWPFCGNANDESGNGNNGTVNGATLTTDRFGNPNAAYDFDGVNDYITAANSSSLQSPTSDLTISAWFKINDWDFNFPPKGYASILSKSTSNSSAQYTLVIVTDNINFIFDGNKWRYNYNGNLVEIGVWNHIAITYSNGVASYYFNNQYYASNEQFSYPNDITMDLEIGRDQPGGTDYFNGKIDDIGIWNRALTEQEITNLYNSCPNPITATITPQGSTTFCAGGFVQLTASAADSYLWSNGETTQTITVTQAGQYSVTVTNNDGCSDTSTPVTVTVNPTPSAAVTASGPTTFCSGGSVTLTAQGTGSYLWSNGQTTQSITVNQTGNYSVTVTNNGCSATSGVTAVTVNPTPTATITASGSTTFCSGGSVTLTASAGGSYLWSNGQTSQSITVGQSGNYSVTVTTNGCSATSAVTNVTVNPTPSAAVTASGPTTFCSGGSVTLTAQGTGSYLWSNGQTTQSITVNQTGNYSVTVTNNGCSATSGVTAVTVNPTPTASITPVGSTTFCQGGFVVLQAAGGGTYQWNTGAQTANISVSQSGTYVVQVSQSGCTSTAQQVVTVNPLPSVTLQPLSNLCQNATAITLGGGMPMGGSYTVNGTPATTLDPAVTGSGTQTVGYSYTDNNGCSNSATQSVTVNAVPNVTLSGLNTNYTLSDASAQLSGSPTGGVYNGSGVSNGMFDPAAAGLGTHGVSYAVVDGNGCVGVASYCTTVDINVNVGGSNIGADGGVDVYPNPSNGQFMLQLHEIEGLVTYTVYDARGREVRFGSLVAGGSRTQHGLDLSAEANGLYTLQLQTAKGIVTQKLVKE